ncbi:MAG: Holliday junction resolvase RuvX [Candidatus Sungbacteria bacterium]|uniref:Holliday junction resolvase RuvX n=1 Tax=Candidatus Sungiibacteriota bacterium TaxID=2750080 RepID=A0A931SDP9_9BACT|nr:Holliday junction resolvase RuvX [Candidatus Sungbacteria bacterium]
MAKREGVGAIVIGLPRIIAGMDASLREEILSVARELEKACKLPVILQDETLTTKIAQKHSAKNVDAAAAALILQSFLDRKNRVL